MSELLKIADAHYLVAANLRGNAQRFIEMAETLEKMADGMCETNMKEAKPRTADAVGSGEADANV